MKAPIYIFVFIMWAMIVGGGGLLFTIIAPLQIQGYGKYSELLDSGVKAVIALMLVVLWIFVMSKVKNWIFQKQVKT